MLILLYNVVYEKIIFEKSVQLKNHKIIKHNAQNLRFYSMNCCTQMNRISDITCKMYCTLILVAVRTLMLNVLYCYKKIAH